jgi:hypothetical protein
MRVALRLTPGARQLYRASGLSPAQYESAGKRRDDSISREGSVALRRALIDLGIGLWRSDPAARRYGQQLRARGKKGGVIGCAMANRANKIAYALVRDQSGYDPGRWALTTGRDSSIAALFVARSSGQPGAPAAQRGRTRLTVASSDAQSGGEEAREKELIWPFHNQACR